MGKSALERFKKMEEQVQIKKMDEQAQIKKQEEQTAQLTNHIPELPEDCDWDRDVVYREAYNDEWDAHYYFNHNRSQWDSPPANTIVFTLSNCWYVFPTKYRSEAIPWKKYVSQKAELAAKKRADQEKKLKRAEEEAKKEAEEKARKEEEAEYVRKFVEQKMKERKAAIAAEKEAKKASWSKFLKDQGEKNAKRENDAREKKR